MRLCDWVDGQTLPFTFRLPKDPKEVLTPTIDVELTRKGERLWFRMLGFSKKMNGIIKSDFNGYKWHGFEEPSVKAWSVRHCAHNWFQILYLAGHRPYGPYDSKLPEFVSKRDVYAHQRPMAAHMLYRRYSILAGEMGVGKTLSLIEALEASGAQHVLYVAPRSALTSVELEFEKWGCTVQPKFVTYHALEKHNAEWRDGEPVYQFVCFDEISRLKNPVAKRTLAAQWIADAVRNEWGQNGWVCGMSGTPAPKSPADWYSICEIVQPGFLREGTIHSFKDRLAVVEKVDNGIGQSYPKLKGWRDDERKCTLCCNFADHEVHSQPGVPADEMDALDRDATEYHAFAPSINEVAKLHSRMAGLVMVVFKKDCLDLPAKRYHQIRLQPTKSMMRAAATIVETAPSTIKALTFLRQLSDGFKYTERAIGTERCGICGGSKVTQEAVYIGPERTWSFLYSIGAVPEWIDPSETDAVPDEVPLDPSKHPDFFKFGPVACANCSGLGEITRYERTVEEVACPKDDAFTNLLEEHEEIGRLVAYGGFTGTIDRIVRLCQEAEWHVIRVDGRGWWSTLPGTAKELLRSFQDRKLDERICFVGQPGAAGMGLTLTASPGLVYYSNDFNAESRIQSEDRIHRAGMDVTRGANIYDLFHLPTDEYVFNNLKDKRRLQDLALGELQEHVSTYGGRDSDQD